MKIKDKEFINKLYVNGNGAIQEKKEESKQKEYDAFMNKQFEILKGHFERCMLRCYNKYNELMMNEAKNG